MGHGEDFGFVLGTAGATGDFEQMWFERGAAWVCGSVENGVKGREESRTNPSSCYIDPGEMCSEH